MLLPTRAQEEKDGWRSDRSGQARICTSTGGMQILLRVERGEIFSDAGEKKGRMDGRGVVVAYKTRPLPKGRKKKTRKGVSRRNEKGKTMLDNCFSLQIVTSSTIRRWLLWMVAGAKPLG